MDAVQTVDRSRLALAVPLVEALGARPLRPEDPAAGVVVPVTGLAESGGGAMHAAALTAVLELAAYLALVPALDTDEHAVSHAVSLQLVAPAFGGSQVEAIGYLERRGRSTAFLTATAEVSGVLVATAQITKSIVPFR